MSLIIMDHKQGYWNIVVTNVLHLQLNKRMKKVYFLKKKLCLFKMKLQDTSKLRMLMMSYQ